ncbi:MAG TPA: DUF6519 domain-containing protein [Candidatus Angelobacter sp.]
MKGDFTRWSFKPQNHYHSVLKQQGRVDVDADWNEQGAIDHHRIETEALDVIGPCGAPADNAGFMLTVAAGGKDLQISKGRAYVDGILCENEQDALVTSQPDLPNFKLPAAAGVYIAYLRVWLRHITPLDDDGIRESALSGPDTCTRAKTVWQVNFLPAGPVGSNVNCATQLAAWDSLVTASSGKMAAQAAPSDSTQTPCTIPAKAGFRRLENQLYRIEIHDAGDSTKNPVTFKWSRDNGSVVTSWLEQKTDPNLTVSSTGRDTVLGFAPGQWIELSDDNTDLNLNSGTLAPLTNVQDHTLVIDPAQAVPAGSAKIANFSLNPKIRRWDSTGLIAMTPGKWQDLEDGVQVQFSNGTFATGDYWMVPARTLKADVEWPVDGSSNPSAEPPVGVRRHYCRLAIAQFDGANWSVLGTCLPTFPALTEITTGQDKGVHITDVRAAKPDARLLNDSDVAASEILGAGIRILCDGALNPVSIQPTTCFVTLELPWPLFDPRQDSLAIFGYEYLVLAGDVRTAAGTTGAEILWRLKAPTGAAAPAVLEFVLGVLNRLKSAQQEPRILARLTLKGNFIWSQTDPNIYLDGEGFGTEQKSGNVASIGVRLPQSGDGKKGGDFQMWFWLGLPALLSGLSISPASVNIGQNATGVVTLTGPAPTGGATVSLAGVVLDASGAQLPGVSIATVPASVNVLAGQASASFAITNTTLPPNVGGPVTLQVTASFGGKTSPPANLSVTRAITLVAPLSLNPATILGAPGVPGNVTGTVNLSGPAPATGAVVALASSNPNAARPAQPTVTVPANQTSIPFTINTFAQPFNTSAQAQITATFGGTSQSATLTVLGARLG